MDFGAVQIAFPPAPQTVRIVNHGSATTISGFSSISGCPEFQVTATGLPVTLADRDTFVFQVSYAPANRGPDLCGFQVVDDNGVADVFGASGSGLAPGLDFTDTLLVYTTQAWSLGTPETLWVSIGDTGNEPIAAPHLGLQLLNGTDYFLGPIALPIDPNTWTLLPVIFNPPTAGTKDDWLTISLDNDLPTDPNRVVHLHGTWSASTAVGEGPPHVSRLRVDPTPTRGTVQLACGVPRAGVVQVDVRDLAGRSIAHLQSEVESPGDRSWLLRPGVDWSPAPGVYLVRVTLDRQTLALGRVVVLR